MRFRAIRDRLIAVLTILTLLLMDILTKRWAIGTLNALPGGVRRGIDGLFRFRFAWNTGAAFSFLSGMPLVIGAVTAILVSVLILIVFLPKRMSLGERLLLSMVLAGGAGNLIDRFVYGAVADFIELEFMSFPVFNFADMAVVSGATLYAVFVCFPKKKGGVE